MAIRSPFSATINIPTEQVRSSDVVNLATQQVSARFTSGQTFANAAYAQAAAILEDLQTYVTSLAVTNPNIVIDPINWQFNYDLPTPPDVAWLEAKDDIPPIVQTFVYDETEYTYSDLFLYIRSRIASQLQIGGSGLGVGVEQAIFDREYERDALAYQDAMSKVQDQWAELNAPMPNGILAGAMNPITIEYQNKRLDKSRAIAEESRKMEVAASQFYTDKGMTMEQMMLDAFNKKWDRVLQASVEEVKMGLQVYDTYIKKFLGYVDAYKAQGGVYEANARGVASLATAEAQYYTIQIGEQGNKLQADIKSYEMYLKKFEIISSLNVEGMKVSGTVASTLAAGALAGISATASLSGSGTLSNANATSVGVSFGTSNAWNYGETADVTPA